MIYTSIIETPIGPLVAGVTESALCLLEFSDPERLAIQKNTLQRLFCTQVQPGEQALHQILREELEQYFSGTRQVFNLPLLHPGSEFQQKVWAALGRIPYGATRSYEELACQVSAPAAARAVGTANGRNRIAILIPCHRVVNKGGGLGGYGGGLWRKQRLLELERLYAG